MKLDAAGRCWRRRLHHAAVFGFTQGAPRTAGWRWSPSSPPLAAVSAAVAFVIVERRAENPVVPFSCCSNRNRLATFSAVFLAGGVMFTLTVLIGLYVQDIMAASALRAGHRSSRSSSRSASAWACRRTWSRCSPRGCW